METMHYSEKRKSSKGPIIALLLFMIIGGAIIVYGISTEEEPVIVGSQESDIQRLVEIEKEDIEAIKNENESITYTVEDVKYNDTSNSKIKSDMTLPKISIQGEELTEINADIDSEYNNLFSKLKEQMASAESKYTYVVSYKVYENMIEEKKVVSITVYQRVRDDSAKKNTTEKVTTYNIDLTSKKLITESEVAQSLLGKDYKSIIKEAAREYVVQEGMMKESEFTYALTGFEDYYVKEGVFHIIFNEGKLADEKYGLLDIEVKPEEKEKTKEEKHEAETGTEVETENSSDEAEE